MDLTNQLNELFNEWNEKFYKKDTLYKDGVINEVNYKQAKQKILFIAKEPNGKNHKENIDRDFRTEWNTTEPSYIFAKRISEWAYGILNNFPVFNEASNKLRALQDIAFMNIKKSAGIGTVEDYVIISALERELDYIKKEIEIIAPDIIILSTGFIKKIREKLFDNAEWKSSGYGVDYSIHESCTIIDFYHPSSRIVAAASYSLLQNVFKSMHENIKVSQR
ncbi:MAG: hypothetical protein H6551_04875 [Chitinophagales bacterium]|nr:hypothetical protein [Chitinophagaceae bacterium]MCB9064460.1 hypothetical protein [Chitinophagales bacterium]